MKFNAINVQSLIEKHLEGHGLPSHYDKPVMTIESAKEALLSILTELPEDAPYRRRSVVQDWVALLPLRAQGSLLVGLRGCDLAPKLPEDSNERQLVAFLRFCILNPADVREVDVPGAFFQSKPPVDWKASEFGHYPQHWYSHLMHSYEVVAYCHPNRELGELAGAIYVKLVHNMHLNPETESQMMQRLTEDRVANGSVVS